MPQPLIIIGTGGNALDILDIVDALNAVQPAWEVAGFLDDSRPRGSTFEGFEILGGLRDAATFADRLFLNAIGSDRSYRKRPETIAQTNLASEKFATLIHPGASVSRRAKLGSGTCVNPGVVIAGGSTIGSHVWLGSGSVIGHDVAIADFAMIAPQAVLSGFARVEQAAYVGAGAYVRQRVTIGERALVGLGSVVIADVAAKTTVVGNPARPLVRVSRGKSGDTPAPRVGLPDPPEPADRTGNE